MSKGDGKKRLSAALDEARRIEKEIIAGDRVKDDERTERLVTYMAEPAAEPEALG